MQGRRKGGEKRNVDNFSNGKNEKTLEVRNTVPESLPAVWQAACIYKGFRSLSYLFPVTVPQGRNTGRNKVKLVKTLGEGCKERV
ncbi:MAG: hypothetical protein A2293_15120 [Elusimicrobia bacterium RIFOXYB2_FULL_49_7]|nr:MAG: hypothetical protein A2293_15120 [Elusimicrobia bacterium RIFOXYB2_FULL_49_7]